MNMDRSYMSVLFGLSDSYRESKKNSFYELFLYINKFIFISGTDLSGSLFFRNSKVYEN